MALNKKAIFDPKIQALAELAKAISHPARIAILQTIATRNSCICGEIVEVMPLAQATVSQHLKELKNAGLIQGEVEGTRTCYCINWEAFQVFGDAFDTFNQKISQNKPGINCC